MMGESSDKWTAEQLADSLDLLADKFWYAGNEDLSRRLRNAAKALREDA